MLEARQNLPEEAADLRVLLASREVEIIGFKAELHSRDLLIVKLKHQLFGLRRHQFGSSSEALDQLERDRCHRSRGDPAICLRAIWFSQCSC